MVGDMSAFKVIDWIVRVLTPCLVAMLMWTVSTLHSLDKRVSVIESNGYTVENALADRASDQAHVDQRLDLLMSTISRIDKELAVLRAVQEDVKRIRQYVEEPPK